MHLGGGLRFRVPSSSAVRARLLERAQEHTCCDGVPRRNTWYRYLRKVDDALFTVTKKEMLANILPHRRRRQAPRFPTGGCYFSAGAL